MIMMNAFLFIITICKLFELKILIIIYSVLMLGFLGYFSLAIILNRCRYNTKNAISFLILYDNWIIIHYYFKSFLSISFILLVKIICYDKNWFIWNISKEENFIWIEIIYSINFNNWVYNWYNLTWYYFN